MARPKQVYVVPFDTGGATIRIAGTKTAAESDAFKQNLATVLADYTVKNVSKHVAPAVKIASAAAAPATGWLVTGRFIRVNTGSRGLRVFVGLGAGGTKMETAVEVIDLAGNRHRPILQFTTTGGSNAMPGLLSSTGPGSAAFSMMTQANTGVTDDAARTSRMITGALSEYFVERGWIAQGQVFKTKKPGDYQLIHGM
ncbi:MAG: hypothetical protein QOE70_5114 [Chthoniobacter sp.]|nr:hypothetical protein [Chthoniobacter sp.]